MKHILTAPIFLVTSLLATACIDEGVDPADPATNPSSGGKSDDVIDTSGELSASLPVLGSPRIMFTPIPFPIATLHFTYASCAKRDWTMKKELAPTADGEVTMLQLETNPLDCFGPDVSRDYMIQVGPTATAQQNFMLLNPSHLSAR